MYFNFRFNTYLFILWRTSLKTTCLRDGCFLLKDCFIIIIIIIIYVSKTVIKELKKIFFIYVNINHIPNIKLCAVVCIFTFNSRFLVTCMTICIVIFQEQFLTGSCYKIRLNCLKIKARYLIKKLKRGLNDHLNKSKSNRQEVDHSRITKFNIIVNLNNFTLLSSVNFLLQGFRLC